VDKLFISYRRADSGSVVGRIYDRLADAFGGEVVFRDIDAIPGAADFRDAIADALDACAIMLVVIGPRWLTERDASGVRRLDDPTDFVRLEVEGALARGIALLPLLVQGAAMPSATDLPPSLAPLSFRNARPVRDDPDFHGDMERVITDVARYVPLAVSPGDAPDSDLSAAPWSKAGVPETGTGRAATQHVGRRIVIALMLLAALGVGAVLLSHLRPTSAFTPILLSPPTVSRSCNGQRTTALPPASFSIANDDAADQVAITWSTTPVQNDGAVTWGMVSPASGSITYGSAAAVTIQFSANLCAYIEDHEQPGDIFRANAYVTYAAARAHTDYMYLSVTVAR
jgi:hypothetical protein